MRWKWMLVVLMVWLSVAVQPAKAEGNIEVEVNVPLSGILKYDSWMRLEVNVTSKEEAFNGFVELSKGRSKKNAHQPALRQPVVIEKGQSKRVYFDMPVQVMLDEWNVLLTQNGQLVQSEKLRLPYPKDGRIVGVVHEGGNAFHFLAINQSQYNMSRPMSVQNLAPEMLPDQAWIYRNLDVLALGGKEASLLNDQQIIAIKEWVQMGGIVILSAGPGQDGIIQKFADIFPIASGAGGSIDLAEGLRSYTGDKVAPSGSIPVYNKDVPLFVSKKAGKGMMLFVNYDVTAEPLASWQHNLQLWQSVLQKHGAQDVLEQNNYMDQMTRPFLELSRMIPDVQTPSPIWMVVLWGGYVFLIAPLTYFVLKRAGKGAWAWGVIPGFAILITVGIFAIGKPLVVKTSASNAISEISILDAHTAQTRTAATFLTVDQDQFDVEVKAPIIALPLTLGRNDYEPEGLAERDQFLSYRNLPYLTPKQALGYGIVRDIGEFETDLKVNRDRLQGRVKNNTRFSYDNLFIEIGLQRIPIGSLKKGEEKQIDSLLEPLFMPRQEKQVEQETIEEQYKRLKEVVLTYGQGNQVRIVGTSNEELPLLTMREPHRAHYWNVVNQAVFLQPNEQGLVTYPYGLLGVYVNETVGEYDSSGPNLWQLGKGSITFELKAGNAQMELERLIVPLDHSSFRPFKIEYFHQKSGRWVPVERAARLVLDHDLQDALTPQQSLLLRFSHNGTTRLSLPTPFFQAEGSERKW
ncbi:hypothetical protein [Brevibacillus reuszeri]|uniref:hypothetical protein n=1 Tax=Brevibacillus reuszeri TaxID=54915 RepID=UPI00289D7C91|nr:hypothetical protein [Brevibacillus reuszeri]